MSFSVEEIAENRRKAQERLRAKQKQQATVVPATATLSSIFYGNSSKILDSKPKTTNNLNASASIEPPNKMRILSQQFGGEPSTVTQSAALMKRCITCTCSMNSENRFDVIISGFHSKLIDTFKTIPSNKYGNYNYNGRRLCPHIRYCARGREGIT